MAGPAGCLASSGRRRQAGGTPIELLLRRLGIRQLKRRRAHRGLVQELPFAHDDDFLSTLKAAGYFNPRTVRHSGLHGYGLGLPLFYDEKSLTFCAAVNRLRRHYERIRDFLECDRQFGKSSRSEGMIGIRQIDLHQQTVAEQ